MTLPNDPPQLRRGDPAAAAPPRRSALAQDLEAYVRARVPVLYLVTWEEERCLREVEAVAAALHKECVVWTETQGARNLSAPDEPEDRRAREPAAILGRIARESRDALYVLVDFHPYLEQNGIRRAVRELAHALVTSTRTVVIVAPRLVLPLELQKEVTVLEVPLPSREELDAHLTAIARHTLGGVHGAGDGDGDGDAGARSTPGPPRRGERAQRAAEGDAGADGGTGGVPVRLDRRERDELVRSAVGMTLQELEQTLALALVKGGRIDRDVIPIVLAEKEQIVKKSSVLEYVRWDEGFEAVGGLDLLKAFLHARREAFTEEARAFGLPPPRGLCLIGVQGCGKSLSAKAVARFYRLPLLRFDIGRVFAGIVGRSEENVRTALRLAESVAPCVLWIDELEKSLSGTHSSSVSDAGTTARVISTITTWLQEHKGEGVYVVATANDITRLPPELLRKGRFDEIFFVDLPTAHEREAVLAIHLRKRGREPQDVDLPRLARAAVGFSGAELEEVVITGLYDAFAARRPLATADLLRAVEQTVPLSATMEEQVTAIRRWAVGRTRRASTAE